MFDNAWLYDLEHQDIDMDVPYWEALLDRYRPARVLEVASGTGRLTFPLLTRGWSRDPSFCIVGLDTSASLVARARERAAHLDPHLRAALRLVEGDMRGFDLGERFDLIIVGFNSLAYIHTPEEHRSCLQAVRRHLAPGGIFAIDLVVPQFSFLAEAQLPAPVLRLELDVSAPEQGVKRLLRFTTERYDAATQTDHTTYHYEISYSDGRQERFTDDLAWHMYFPRELALLLEAAELRPVERYGSYSKTPFGPRSTQYLWIMSADEPG